MIFVLGEAASAEKQQRDNSREAGYDRGFRRDIHTKFSCLLALLLLYFACALSVLPVCFLAANAQEAQTKVQIPDLCKAYVHNM